MEVLIPFCNIRDNGSKCSQVLFVPDNGHEISDNDEELIVILVMKQKLKSVLELPELSAGVESKNNEPIYLRE